MNLATDPSVDHFHDDDLDVAACRDPRDEKVYVLVVSTVHRCGYRTHYLAPGWKLPPEHGGGFMTDECPKCLGTLEFDEEWWPRSDFSEGST